MNKIAYIISTCFVLSLTISSLKAQESSGLKIGDQLPDFTITKLITPINGVVGVPVQTTAFQDRLMIIDFWATTCSGCVAALPKMEELQRKFGDKIKILPVTYEDKILVMDFWKKNKYTRQLTLSTIVEDQLFKKHFPHEAMPHEVWIYKGKVIGITEAEYVDSHNIQQILNGKIPNWPVKNDYYTFDGNKQPLFTPSKKQVDIATTMLNYAAISDYKEKDGASAAGLYGSSGVIRDSIKKTVRTYFINQSILSSYLINWSNILKIKTLVKPSFSLDPNQIIWEVGDPTRYTNSSSSAPDLKTGYRGDWMRKNAICFESVYLDTGQSNKDISKSVIRDLNRLLGLKVRWEKRKEKVLVLVRSVKKPAGAVKPSKTDENTVNSLSELIYKLNQQAKNPYVFNEIKSEAKLNLNIASWTDLATIRKALQTYGLTFKEEERLVDKFVFSEKEGLLLVDVELITNAKARRQAQKNLGLPALELNKSFLEVNKTKPGVVMLPSGLQYKIIKKGAGPKPGLENRVKVHYTGLLVNGRIFESSFEGGKPVVLGVNEVIKGWTEALQLMPVGSKWELYIPAGLAYGSLVSDDIPENSTLIFELELLEIAK